MQTFLTYIYLTQKKKRAQNSERAVHRVCRMRQKPIAADSGFVLFSFLGEGEAKDGERCSIHTLVLEGS